MSQSWLMSIAGMNENAGRRIALRSARHVMPSSDYSYVYGRKYVSSVGPSMSWR